MNPRQYERAMQLVDVLMDCAPEEIETRLREGCAGDDSLRREVEKLLAQDNPASRFLEESPLEVLSSLPLDEEPDHLIGKHIGPYHITEEIGRGGMGKVYKGVRDDEQYRTEVAIKLIKLGMDTDFILRRFRNERQILANLNHPNIARLLDGGTTEAGLPYFVMEHIEGKPIDKYCDTLKLSTLERLKLFRMVCAALSYAHGNLIVHRDLKPSNILVTAEGTPKLLDFGIAKLLHLEPDSTMTAGTATELRAMTPEYASPEQVKGESITTASDVYSLGVLLYELLTGHRPYRFQSRRPEEVARVISEVEPERPSTAISRVEETKGTDDGGGRTPMTPESVSEVREGEPEKLRRRLQGDIDNIVLKALRKAPERRYGSVEQFSEDIRRYLEGLPVSARKDTLSYRTGKFVQRHKAGVLAASLIIVALIGGMGSTLWQARVAQRERARAERRFNDVRRLANSFMFEFHDEVDKGPLKAKELLVKKAIEYLDSLSKEAGGDTGLQRELATAYARIALIQGGALVSNLDDTKGALESERKALAIRELLAKIEPNNPEIQYELASSYNSTGEAVDIRLGKPAEALPFFRKAQIILEPLVAANPSHREFRKQLGFAYRAIGEATSNTSEASSEDRSAARQLHLKSLELYESLAAQDPNDLEWRRRLAANYASLGIRLNVEGRIAESVEYFRKAQAVDDALIAADRSNIIYRRQAAVTVSNLGVALLKLGDKAGALDHARKALALYQQLVEDDKNDANARKDLAIGYRNLGQASADSGGKLVAAESYLQAIDVFEDLISKDPNNAYNRRQLALTLLRFSELMSDTKDLGKAINYGNQAVTVLEKLIAADAKNVGVLRTLAHSYAQLGKCHVLLARGRRNGWQEARAWYQKSLSIWQDMKAKGALGGADKTKLEEVEREITSGDAAMKK